MRTIRLDELTDSRILYEKRPPAFGFFIIALTLIVLVASLSWSATTIKPSVVQGSGVVQSANRTEVMSTVTGSVLEVLTPNGSIVEQSATMIRLDSPDLSVEKQSLVAQSDMLRASLAFQDRYANALDERANGFDPENPSESLYYYQYETLNTQIAKLRVDPASMREIGYSETEIQNAIKSNQLSADELSTSAMSESLEKAAEIRRQMEEVQIRLSAIDTGGASYSVLAAASGEVFLDPGVKPGTVIAAGETLGTIASANGDLTTRVMIAVPDRQFVGVGDRVKVSVLGLPSLLYDKIDGVVSRIDNDITLLPGGTSGVPSGDQSFFVVELKLEQFFTADRDGAQHELGNGTAIQAELVYSEVTYLQYFREMLGLG